MQSHPSACTNKKTEVWWIICFWSPWDQKTEVMDRKAGEVWWVVCVCSPWAQPTQAQDSRMKKRVRKGGEERMMEEIDSLLRSGSGH